MKIIVLDGYGLNPGDLSWEEISQMGELTVYERTNPDQLIQRARGAEVLITNKTLITAADMEQLPELRYIGVLATGYNVVDIKAAAKRRVIVTNIPAYSTNSVAQMVFAHILNIATRVGHYARENASGRWAACPDFCYWDTPLIELAGKTIGIIGLGHTGYATARIADAFGMNIIAYTSKIQNELTMGIQKGTLEEVFAGSDFISLNCPLTESTYHLVNAERLSLMKPTASIINTGRGPLIDEQALAEALNEGRIAAAGLDVLTNEPPLADCPLTTARNCFITPHIAWATKEARERLMSVAAANLRGYIAGKVKNKVN